MSGMGVDLRGFNQTAQRLQQLAKQDATKAGQSANRAGATVLKKAIEKAAPDSSRTTEGEVRTRHTKGGGTRTEVHGKIKNNVIVRKTKSTNANQVQNTVGVRGNAYHSSFVNFGSIHNTADPFVLRALNSSDQTVIDKIAVTLNKQLIKRGV